MKIEGKGPDALPCAEPQITVEQQHPFTSKHTGDKAKCDEHPALATVRALPSGFAFLPIWGVETRTNLDKSHLCGCGRFTCDSPGKHPIGPLVWNGVHGASADAATIARWFGQYPDANLGISSPDSRYVIIDEDPRNGGDADALGLPPTVTAQTGGGGRHFYFRVPEGVEIGGGNLGKGIDLISAGKYVVAPPSRHASGEYYRWAPSRGPTELEIADLPPHIVDQLQREPQAPLADRGPCSFEEAVSALNAISADLSYPDWRDVSFAFADAARDDPRGFAAWDSWCRTAPEKYRAAEQEKHWKSFDRPGAITKATLFHMAQENGWPNRAGDYFEFALRESANWGCTPEAEAAILDMIVQAVERGKTQPRETLFKSAADLQHKRFEELKFILPGIVPEGTTVFAGRPKIGKSWLTLDLALAVATGGECLGRKCAKGDALLLALEDSDRRLQRRMTRLLGLYKSDWPQGVRYATAFPNDGQQETLIEREIQRNPNLRLIVIDTWVKYRRPKTARQADYDQDYHAIARLQSLSSKYGVAIVVVHHTRKSRGDEPIEEISGTNGIAGAADGYIVIRGTAHGKMLVGEGRDLEGFEMAIEFDKESCRWNVLGSPAEAFASDTARKILDVLRGAAQALGPKAIAEQAGLNENAVKQRLRGLVDKGIVEQGGRGRYRLAIEPF